MDQNDLRHITGRRKAAALLISLGAELAAQVLKTMREDEVELLTREIVRMERLPAEMKDAIMQQVYEDAMARQLAQVTGERCPASARRPCCNDPRRPATHLQGKVP